MVNRIGERCPQKGSLEMGKDSTEEGSSMEVQFTTEDINGQIHAVPYYPNDMRRKMIHEKDTASFWRGMWYRTKHRIL